MLGKTFLEKTLPRIQFQKPPKALEITIKRQATQYGGLFQKTLIKSKWKQTLI